jgi:hypothetical protein
MSCVVIHGPKEDSSKGRDLEARLLEEATGGLIVALFIRIRPGSLSKSGDDFNHHHAFTSHIQDSGPDELFGISIIHSPPFSNTQFPDFLRLSSSAHKSPSHTAQKQRTK